MTSNTFDLDIDIVPAYKPRPEEFDNPHLAQAAADLEGKTTSCTPPTRNTYTYGVGKCLLCCF